MMATLDIPLPCPSCDGKMYSTRYETPLNVLRERGWQVCKQCGFERTTEDFKNELLTV